MTGKLTKKHAALFIRIYFCLDSSKAALTQTDTDEILELIQSVPLVQRQDWVAHEYMCQICEENQTCSCRLEYHQRTHHREYFNFQAIRMKNSCPFCVKRFTNKCSLLKRIFMEHNDQEFLAMEALKERQHFDEYYAFKIISNTCSICKRK